MTPELAAAAAALRAARRTAVVSHQAPEGDAIGTTVACVLALQAWGRVAHGYNADPVPANLACLPSVDLVRRAARLPAGYDCCLVLDTTDRARTGGLLDGLGAGVVVVNVDHHRSNARFGTVNWVAEEASSAGEMALHLLRAVGAPVDRAAATNLYAAIATDTGSFQYPNTTPAALRAAAELVELGAGPAEIAEGLYEGRDPGELRLLGAALAGLGLTAGGRVAWIEVPRALWEGAGVGLAETEGFVNYPRAVRGARVAAAFKELGPETVRVSLRSRAGVDVGRIAAALGGGGHPEAAGCTLSAPLPAVRARVLAALAAAVGGGGAERG
jgi:phosphoesterase RecJ-like protein